MTETWFVTGAAGFIGCNLAAHLLARGDRVVGFDNLATGTRANVERLEAAGGDFAFVEGDVRDGGAVERAMDGASRAVHLAAQVTVQDSIRDYVENDSINVGGFLNALRAAGRAGVRTFAYASSCAVYGDNPHLPLAESAPPRPLSPYGVSKLAGEEYARVLDSSLAATTLVGLRLFNVYGPWQNAEGGYAAVIPKWIDRCLKGERPVMYGDGSASRDFCFVGDVARLIADLGGREAKRPHRVYNVGSGSSTTLRELFRTMARCLQRAGRELPFDAPEQQPWRAGDIVHSLADVSRARDELRFRPRVPLAEGLQKTLAGQFGLG
jgi:UDP-N-acetylglucosamine 4-epimerase